MKKFTYKNDQAGRSMIEMLGVLAIVGVLSVGGIAGYSKAMAKFKVGKTQDAIMTVVNNIRTLYGASADYEGLNTTSLRNAKMFPKDLVASDGSADTHIVNAFGGRVSVSGDTALDTAGAAAASSFYLHLTGLPREACMSLASADWGTESAGLISVAIAPDNTTVSALDGTITTYTWGGTDDLPVTAADAVTECTVADGEFASVSLRFY